MLNINAMSDRKELKIVSTSRLKMVRAKKPMGGYKFKDINGNEYIYRCVVMPYGDDYCWHNNKFVGDVMDIISRSNKPYTITARIDGNRIIQPRVKSAEGMEKGFWGWVKAS